MFISDALMKKLIHDLDGDSVKMLLLRLRYGESAAEKITEQNVNEEFQKETIYKLKDMGLWEINDLEAMQIPLKGKTDVIPSVVHDWLEKIPEIKLEEMKEQAIWLQEGLLRLIEKETGRDLTYKELYLILYCMEELGLSNELIVELFHRHGICEDYDTLICRAEEWERIHITDLEELEWYESRGKIFQAAIKVTFMLNRPLSYEEVRYAFLWGMRYKYPVDLVVYACMITLERTGNEACPYADAVLRNLKESGFESLKDMEVRKGGSKKLRSDIRKAQRIVNVLVGIPDLEKVVLKEWDMNNE